MTFARGSIPGSAPAGSDGAHLDVLEAMRGLAPTHLRYPAGNFVSGYRWRDGIDPRELRPIRHKQAWEPRHCTGLPM